MRKKKKKLITRIFIILGLAGLILSALLPLAYVL